MSRLRDLLRPKWNRADAQTAVEESRISLKIARARRAISEHNVVQIEEILEQNNFGANAIKALRLRGDI